MSTYDPTGCILDGAIPRTEATRVADLLTYNVVLFDHFGTTPATYHKHWDLVAEKTMHDDDYEHWSELEEDVIELINETLPDEYYCGLHPDDPGTVCVWLRDDEETD